MHRYHYSVPEIDPSSPVPPVLPVASVASQPINHGKPFLPVTAVAAILLISSLAFGAYQLGRNQVSQPESNPKSDATSPAVETPTVSPAVSTPSSNPTDPTADWKIYEDKGAGVSFKYPMTVTLTSEGKGIRGLVLMVNVDKVSSLPEEAPLNLDRKTAEDRQSALSFGKIGQVTAFGGNTTLITLGKTFGQTSTTFGMFEVCDVRIDKSLIFYNNGYQIIISLYADVAEVEKSMPEYFTVDKSNCGDSPMWDRSKDFYKAVMAGKGSGVAQDWYATFDNIVESISVT